MGQLSSVIWETKGVEATPGTVIEFRGLNATDIMRLAMTSKTETEQAFQLFLDHKEVNKDKTAVELVSDGAVHEAMLDLVREMPDLVCRLFCIAADDESQAAFEVMKRAPTSFQLEALDAIMELSLRSDAEIKKVGAVLLRIVGNLTLLMEAAKQKRSKRGSGKSEKQ